MRYRVAVSGQAIGSGFELADQPAQFRGGPHQLLRGFLSVSRFGISGFCLRGERMRFIARSPAVSKASRRFPVEAVFQAAAGLLERES